MKLKENGSYKECWKGENRVSPKSSRETDPSATRWMSSRHWPEVNRSIMGSVVLYFTETRLHQDVQRISQHRSSWFQDSRGGPGFGGVIHCCKKIKKK